MDLGLERWQNRSLSPLTSGGTVEDYVATLELWTLDGVELSHPLANSDTINNVQIADLCEYLKESRFTNFRTNVLSDRCAMHYTATRCDNKLIVLIVDTNPA
jgi:hypothetical protein